jgi:hypothetical protein
MPPVSRPGRRAPLPVETETETNAEYSARLALVLCGATAQTSAWSRRSNARVDPCLRQTRHPRTSRVAAFENPVEAARDRHVQPGDAPGTIESLSQAQHLMTGTPAAELRARTPEGSRSMPVAF